MRDLHRRQSLLCFQKKGEAMSDPFASVRDKRMNELTDEQKDVAHELWLREQMGPSWPLRETLEAVLRVVDRLRVDAERYRKLREVLQGAVGSGVEFCDAKLVYEEPTPGKEWRIFWYPDSPVSFHQVSGASLDEAVDQLPVPT